MKNGSWNRFGFINGRQLISTTKTFNFVEKKIKKLTHINFIPNIYTKKIHKTKKESQFYVPNFRKIIVQLDAVDLKNKNYKHKSM